MTSQAVYCLSLQIRPPSEDNSDGITTDVGRNSGNGNNGVATTISSSATTTTSKAGSSTSSSSKTNTNLDKGLHSEGNGGGGGGGNGIDTNSQQSNNNGSNNNSSSTVGGNSGNGGGSSGGGGGCSNITTIQHHHQHQQTSSHTKTVHHHHHHHQQQQQHQHQQQQHSNIILVRGARTENGQIILQNSHELLSLLNDDDNKPIILQHQRIKTTATKTHGENTTGSTILLQTPIKGGQLEAGTVLLQSANIKKNILPEGSIILQQRLSKSGNLDGTLGNSNNSVAGGGGGNGPSTSSGGPFLLQTLKRLDKSQSILVFRNPNNTTTHAAVVGGTSIGTSTTSSASSSSATSLAATLSLTSANRITKLNNVNNNNSSINSSSSNNHHNNSNNNGGNSNSSQSTITGSRGSRAGSLDDAEDKPEPIQQKQMNVPLGSDGEPIKLPDNLESLPRADHFPTQRHRWNTNEEIAAILISFDKHSEWQSKEVKTRPKSGSLLLYSRKKVRYRRDGYCWKKRKDGKTTREDHMKLKVQGTECIYGCYVHSAILPTFHRRCYWLLQNPDIVLVHYLNVPYPDDNKMAVITPSLSLWGDKKEWTKEELVSQLKPMFFSEDEPDSANDIEISTAETVETIVSQLMEKQRLARQAALVKQLECGCPDSTCADGKSCSHPMRRVNSSKTLNDKRQESNNQVSSTTPNVLIGPRLYSRWIDRRNRESVTDLSQKSLDGSSIHFQVIPNLHNHSSLSNHHQHHQQQQHHLGRQHNPNLGHTSQSTQLSNNSTSATTSNQPFTNASNHGNQINRIANNNNVSQMIINTNSHHNTSTGNSSHSANNTSSIGTTTLSINSNNHSNSNSNSGSQLTSHSNQQQISLASSSDNNNLNNLTNNDGHHRHHPHQSHLSMSSSGTITGGGGGGGGSASSSVHHHHHQQQQQQQQQQQHQHQQSQHPHHHQQQHHQQSIIDSNIVNQRVSSNLISNTSSGRMTLSAVGSSNGGGGGGCSNNNSNGVGGGNDSGSSPIVTSAPPLVLNLSQLQTSGSSLLILNGQQQPFVCQSPQQQHSQRKSTCTPKNEHSSQQSLIPNLVPKQEAMESSSSSSICDKQMDSSTYEMSYSSTLQTTTTTTTTTVMESSDKENNLVKDLNDSLPFFNETLDLSQEDIQKTLSANMPLSNDVSNSHDDGIDSDINPMDFIDNVCDVGVVNSNPNGCVGPSGHDPDDVFVNLDAFDMLVEFPDLELDTKSAFPHDTLDDIKTHTNLNDGDNLLRNGGELQQHQQIFNITDYSPEWAYPEGGVKVLVTGPWSSTASSYTVLFDSFPVPTTVVQEGVLRCYCPAHEVGLATLQVACDGYVISNSVIFEYKSPPNMETICEGTANDSLYKFTLLNRLSSIDDRMQIKTEPKDLPEDSVLISQSNFEERLVNYCQILTNKTWRSMTPGSWPTGHRGMTLLHLASALGYSKLVCAMLTWRSENPNVILETEIDALSQDIQGYTPLMWSCYRGHLDTAIILYKWNHNSINIKNCLQQTPLDIARMNGFNNITSEFERFEKDRIEQQQQQQQTLGLSSFTQTFLNSPITADNDNSNNSNTNYTYEKSSSNSSSSTSNSTSTSNSSNQKDDNNRKNSNNNNKSCNDNSDFNSSYNNSNSPDSNQGNNRDHKLLRYQSPSPKSNNANNGNDGKILNNNNNNNSNKDNESNGSSNNNANNENLSSQCLSPTSNGSIGSVTSNRSHDGVFLRPGAVSSGQSPPSLRLSKRPSVDSGINMDMRSLSRSGKIFRDHNKFHSFDANDNFSLSMDSSADGTSGTSSLTSSSLLSPLRKMDFALCEVSAVDTSPMQDKQPGASSDDEDISDANNMNDNGLVVVGESDAKVLTLAEHIIAAMPERIKNESEEIMSLGSPMSETLNTDTSGMSGINDTFMEPLLDSLSTAQFDHEFNFEFSDHSYRYHDVGTPCSSLSPASSGPLQSPASYSIPPDPPMSSPSPPPSAQELTEFLQASSISQRPFEADFSNLTLTDREQRELYEAAKCIQKAYRSYKGRKKLEEQDKERSAAIVIQNYYRRYKQFAYFRQMTHAALVIQNGYRSYCENKRFKKSQNQNISTSDEQNSQCLQDYYKTYQNDQQQQQQQQTGGGSTSKEASPSGPLKRTYSQRTQNQAARKIQQFMRQSKMKLQRERAEKERLVHQRRAEYLQNLQYQGQQEMGRIQEQNDLQGSKQNLTNSTSTTNINTRQQHFWNPQ